MNNLKIVLAAIKGFLLPGTTVGAEIVSVVLQFVSVAMGNLNEKTKENITKCLSVVSFALRWMYKVQDWIPVKWQASYRETIEAVQSVIWALSDFTITDAEYKIIQKEFEEARAEWESDD